ncbi:MAG: tetratricopeptide repeat protein [Myxococcota bacterium]
MADDEQQHNPVLSDEMNAKGIEFADRGWLDEAIRYFERAIELDPASGHAWDNLAGVLAEKRAWRESLRAHLRSIELEPDIAASHYNLASFLMTFGLEMAEAELREALQADPEYPDARLSLGMALADMGRTDEAIAELEAAIELDPEDAYPRHELALLLMDENDIRGAIGLLREVVRLEPENFEAHLDLGVCYSRKGFFAEAERAFQAALQLRTDDLHASYGMASLYALWNREDEAVDHLGRAFRKDKERVRLWLSGDPTFDGLRERPEVREMMNSGQS